MRRRVQGILYQLLNDAGRAFNHLTGGNLIGHLFGEQADAIHKGAILRRTGYFANGKEKQKVAPRPEVGLTQILPP